MVNIMILPKVASVTLQLADDHLIATCEESQNDKKSIKIPIKVKLEEDDEIEEGEFKNRKMKGVVCSRKINEFFSDYLATPVKLLQHLPELEYRPANSVKKINESEEKKYNIMFQNYVDFHFISIQSLDLLNQKIAENSGSSNTVSGLNFRPNMFVTDTFEPFQEDKWKYIKFRDNTTKFVQIENCFRCANTTIEDGQRKEPLHTLRKFRRSRFKEEDKRVNSAPFFGVLCGTLNEGIIRKDDKIEAVLVDFI